MLRVGKLVWTGRSLAKTGRLDAGAKHSKTARAVSEGGLGLDSYAELGYVARMKLRFTVQRQLARPDPASAFLLPANEIRPQLKRFDLRQLANLKSYWKVSMAALAMRVDRLNLITPYQKKSFWMEMSRLGYRKREPNEPDAELPQRLARMVQFHQRDLGYSRNDMASLLDLVPEEFDRLYGDSGDDMAGRDQRRPTARLQLVK